MAIRLPKFRVDVPYGKFSRRIILTSREARLRDRIANRLNRWLEAEVLKRRPERNRGFDRKTNKSWIEHQIRRQVLFELSDERKIYSIGWAEVQGRIDPTNITYEQVLGPAKSLPADPPRLRTAADYFLDFLNHRRLDENLVNKFPLLAAFLDAARVNEETEYDFKREEIMARAGASEKALCAGLLGRYLKPEQWMLVNTAEVMDCGLRLGVDQALLAQKMGEIVRAYVTFSQAMALTLKNLNELVKRFDLKENPFNQVMGGSVPETEEYEVKTDDEQIKNFIILTRRLLIDRDTRLLYAAQNLCDLMALARERIAAAEKRGVETILKEPLTPDKTFSFYFVDQEEVARLQYFLQVIPIVEELKIPYLTDTIKEAYFMAYKPLEYLRVSYQLGEVFRFNSRKDEGPERFSQAAAQQHMDNIIRLIREVGYRTGLLPEGAEIRGRVKSLWSAHEKFVDQPEQKDPLLADILGVRILVKDLSDIRKVAYLMLRTFLRACAEEKRPLNQYLPAPLREYLEALKRDLTSGEHYKKDYRRGIKNTIKSDFRVHYYQMILLSYLSIPMDVQITTFEMEAANEAQAPHWEYKLLRQLRMRGLGKGIERGDFTAPEDRVIACKIDGATRIIKAEAIPKEEATLANQPGYQWVLTWEGRAADPDERPTDMQFRNGTLLYKPTALYSPSKIYKMVWVKEDEDPFLFPRKK